MLLFLDVETGGLDPKVHSLLEIAAVITDEDFNIVDVFSHYVKPDNSVVVIHPLALQVNKIDLAKEHYATAVGYSVAKGMFKGFLSTRKEEYIPVGWNVQFDIDFITSQLFCGNREEVRDCLSYRLVDLQSVVRFAQLAGWVKSDVKLGSLLSVARFFGIAEIQQHRAYSDCMLTIEIARKLKQHGF